MTSELKILLIASAAISLLSASAGEGNSYVPGTNGEFSIIRPFLFRSEFVSNGTFNRLRNYSLQPGYNLRGAPIFSHVYERKLLFWETGLARSRNYANRLNLELAEKINRNPSAYKKIFSSETIRDYSKGDVRLNPRGVNGEGLQWHHNVDTQSFRLVKASEHNVTRGGKPHIGGQKIWGEDAAHVSSLRQIVMTGQRWGQLATLDLMFSSAGLWISGERKTEPYFVNAAATVSAGVLAWGTESLLLCSFPLLQGSTPFFLTVLLCPVAMGGPASWIATGIYFGTKYMIVAGWTQYRIAQAARIENACRKAERKTRMAILDEKVNYNTQALLALQVSRN